MLSNFALFVNKTLSKTRMGHDAYYYVPIYKNSNAVRNHQCLREVGEVEMEFITLHAVNCRFGNSLSPVNLSRRNMWIFSNKSSHTQCNMLLRASLAHGTLFNSCHQTIDCFSMWVTSIRIFFSMCLFAVL